MQHIKAGIVVENVKELQLAVIGERLGDYEKFFSDIFIDKFKAVIDHDNWGVWFKQIDELKPKFYIDIFVDDPTDWTRLANVVKYATRENDIDLELMPKYWNFDRF